jgi:exodeoxyribonuclease VII large subunit
LTSLEGAALQDILYVLKTNDFKGDVYIKNCMVQGVGCPSSVREGIEYFNKLNNKIPIDILLVSRGGGAITDLLSYSEEEVVKAIYESNIFTISGVGHEIDTMLIDYAVDYRAPTPSVAAETIVKYQKKENEIILKYCEKLKQLEYVIESKITNNISKLNNLKSIHKSLRPDNIIDNEIERLNKILKKIYDKRTYNVIDVSNNLEKLKQKNNMYSTEKILKKGYTIITNENDDLIDTLSEFKNHIDNKIKLKITFSDGSIFI